MRVRAWSLISLLVLGAGCDADEGDPDAGPDRPDTGPSEVDAGPPGPDWSCVGEVGVGAPAATEIEWTVHVRELATDVDAGDVTIRACARDDEDCASPISEGVTDRLGNATLTLPTGDEDFAERFVGEAETPEGEPDAPVDPLDPDEEDTGDEMGEPEPSAASDAALDAGGRG